MAVALAWIGWLGLRSMGRRYVIKPNLAEKINNHYRPHEPLSEYHI